MSYEYRTPADETRETPDRIIVKRTRILSTQCVVYSAWERASHTSHSTITTINGEWYGTLHSRRDDSSYRDLPGGSDERIAAVRAKYAQDDAESYAAICAAFPEARGGKLSDGEIEMWY